MLALAMRQPIPELFVRAPELQYGLGIFLQAFHDVLSERPPNYGELLPLPRSKVREWIQEKGITDPELIERLYSHVRSLDLVYRQFVAKQAKQAEPENVENPKRWD